jgi:transposase
MVSKSRTDNNSYQPPARVLCCGSSTPANDLLAELTRIGIDEMAYRKGQRYLTVIVDHGTGRLVWAAEG